MFSGGSKGNIGKVRVKTNALQSTSASKILKKIKASGGLTCLWIPNFTLILSIYFPASIYQCEVNKRNTKAKCERCSNLTDVVLMSLLLTLSRFHKLLSCFYCWLWTNKCRLDCFSVDFINVSCDWEFISSYNKSKYIKHENHEYTMYGFHSLTFRRFRKQTKKNKLKTNVQKFRCSIRWFGYPCIFHIIIIIVRSNNRNCSCWSYIHFYCTI